MRVALMRLHADLRRTWRSWIAIAMLVSIGGAAVLTAASAARRTETAYPRFLDAYGGADLLASDRAEGESFFDGAPISVDAFAAMSGVLAVEKIRFYLLRNPALDPASDEGYFVAEARSPERSGPIVDGHKILEGRDVDPTRVDEAVVTLPGASVPWLRVGAIFTLAGVPEVFPEFAAAVERKPLTIRIVGAAAVAGDFPPQSGDETIALRLTPAFYERYPEQAFGFPGGAALRLQPSGDALDRFHRAYEEAGGNTAFTLDRRLQDANVQRSIHLQAIALWALAALGALSLFVIVTQVVSRQVFIDADDVPALRALGCTRSQLVATVTARTLIAAVAGSILAVAAAIAGSMLFPRGLAKVAEPDPGLRIDALILGVGIALLLFAVAVVAFVAAWRETAASRRAALRSSGRVSRVAEAIARGGRVPSLLVGARLALQRGSGRSAMPVASTLGALILGVGVFGASMTFASSMEHFLATPRLYGVTWDARVGIESPESFEDGEHTVAEAFDLERIARELIERDPDVGGVAIGRTGVRLASGDLLLEALVMDPVVGDAPLPPLLDGRYPEPRPADQPQEIVLGRRAAELLDVSVGDALPVEFSESGEERTLTVVGVGVVPLFGDAARLGESALIRSGVLPTGAGLPEDLREVAPQDLFIRGNVDLDLIAEIAGNGARVGDHVHTWAEFPPTDVVNFGRVRSTPMILGGLLAAFAAATLLHTLLTAIGRRRRDLAILKTLGFVRAQIRRTVRAQALLLTVLAILIGAPLGVGAGRVVWITFADGIGVVAEPALPIRIGIAAIVGAVLLSLLLASLPARIAARTSPAVVLRSE